MCGSLRYNHKPSRLGDLLPVINPATGKQGTAEWSGFAKSEKLAFWNRNGNAVPISVVANSIVEQNIELKLRGIIKAIGLKKDVYIEGKLIGKAGSVKIVTRPPANEFEKRIHARWPIVKMNNGECQVFTSNDMIKGPGELALL